MPPVTGFGALADGGLAWREGGEIVALDRLGDVFARPTLNELMALGPAGWREAIDAARAHDGPRLRDGDAWMRLPFEVADYVDFYASLEHASNLGACSVPTRSRCSPTGAGCPSATTVVRGR